MTDKTQPDSGRATGGIVEMLHARIAELEARVQELGAMARENRSRRIVELEAQLEAVSAGGVSPLIGQPQAMPDLTNLTERGAVAWAGVDAQALRDGTYQQAAPKAAPVEWTEQDALGILKQLSDGPFGQGDVDDALDFMRLVDTARRDKAAPGEPVASAAKGAIMGAAYDFRDAHISGSMNLKRSAHAALEDAVDNALVALAAPQQEAQEPVAYIHVPHHTVEGKVHTVVSFEKYQQDYADGIYSTRIPLYTAPQPAPAPLSRDQIREVFMAHGFTVKEGQTDLKQYVYDAAYALLGTKPAPLSDEVVKDAARWRMLPAFFAEYQIDAMKLYRDVDAALAAQGGKDA